MGTLGSFCCAWKTAVLAEPDQIKPQKMPAQRSIPVVPRIRIVYRNGKRAVARMNRTIPGASRVTGQRGRLPGSGIWRGSRRVDAVDLDRFSIRRRNCKECDGMSLIWETRETLTRDALA